MREEQTAQTPPAFIAQRGAPILAATIYREVQGICGGLPELDVLPALSGQELLMALQWAAPWRVLGRFPELPKVRREKIIAASPAEIEPALTALDGAVEAIRLAETVTIAPSDGPPQLFFFDEKAPEWAALYGLEAGAPCLAVSHGFAAIPGDRSVA
jgi:hypothetical protein